MLDSYLNVTQIVLLIAAFVLAICAFLALWILAPKHKEKINYRKNLALITIYLCSFTALTMINFKTGMLSSKFVNIAYAYEDYGFTYCFSTTLLNSGMDKPVDYNKETIDNIIKNLPKQKNATKKPNIIMLQLESFFDAKLLSNVILSEDPVPNFTKLKQNYSSGFLNVPTIGAGTANSEFEIITGMNLDFFGTGEYPYKTILKKTTAESIAFNLKSIGYKAHAIHNNETTFYDRNHIFSQLGFDTFTAIEYMNVSEFTPTEWAKDKILTEQILTALNSTTENDFIYTISVQGHGPYPEEPILENPKIQISGIDSTEVKNEYEYFINQTYEMDIFIGDLIKALEAYGEETILVLYGDHLPSLNLKEEDLKNDSIFQTEYVIWDNFGLDQEDKELQAFQLTSSIFDKIDLNIGTLMKFHQGNSDKEEYLIDLELLQYDMLYGDKFVYNEINPFEATDLQLGIKPITINNVYIEDDLLYIEGSNFTEYSKVSINGDLLATEYKTPNLLVLSDFDISKLNISDEIVVNQMGYEHTILSSTVPFIY
jgi:phosphoglycerol transferase MdoB-like AlkP superfamily enzyme